MWADRPILLVHNAYTEAGGEDVAFENDVQLLRSRGHDVVTALSSNTEMLGLSRTRAAATMTWNAAAAAGIEQKARACGAAVVHFHNTFPLLSPAIYAAASRAGAAVVQTLHNYRLVCAAGTLLRDGSPCELCVGRVPWRAAAYACYRGSHGVSGATAVMTQIHRTAGTWNREIDAFIALTHFARNTFVRGGLPADRIHVRPNFLMHDPGPGPHDGGFMLFAGRLAPEKGIATLLEAAALLPEVRVVIAGDGPLRGEVSIAATVPSNIEYAGSLDAKELGALMHRARALLVPSIWYEGFPMVLAEAFARSLPIIASDLGALATIVRGAAAGWLVPPRDAGALAATIAAVAGTSHDVQEKSAAARQAYLNELSPDAAYASLSAIYDSACVAAV